MERLQAAIEKARTKRSGSRATRRNLNLASRILEPELDEAWTSIREVFVDPEQLALSRVVANQTGHGPVAINLLRTRVLHQMREQKFKRIAITSPTAGCGKSTMVANLATSLARQGELRTLVLEMDMRRPALAKIFGFRKGSGSLSEVIEGKISFSEHAVRFGKNLIFGFNHKPADRPSELLSSADMTEFLAEIEEKFQPDIMLFDMPPMLLTDDTLGFLNNVQTTMLIAAAGTTTIEQIDVCERDIAERSAFLGVVLNKCEYLGAAAGYEYSDYS